MGYRRCKAAGASDGSAAGNVDHHDTLDWANLLLEDGGDGRRVDSSGDGDGSSGADGACGCCGDAEAGWRLLMAVTGLTGAARRSPPCLAAQVSSPRPQPKYNNRSTTTEVLVESASSWTRSEVLMVRTVCTSSAHASLVRVLLGLA